MVAAIIVTAAFGYFGFTIAYSSIILSQDAAFAFGALLPFIICFVVCLDQYAKMKKEKKE